MTVFLSKIRLSWWVLTGSVISYRSCTWVWWLVMEKRAQDAVPVNVLKGEGGSVNL